MCNDRPCEIYPISLVNLFSICVYPVKPVYDCGEGFDPSYLIDLSLRSRIRKYEHDGYVLTCVYDTSGYHGYECK